MKLAAIVAVAILCANTMALDDASIAAMKQVHAKGTGQKGSVSQIGDSITYTKAFMAGMAWGEVKGPEFKALTERVNGKHFNDRKGADHCNYSGWTAADGLGKIKTVLAAEKPELAVIMYGTNDVNKGVAPAAYEKSLAGIVDACLKAGCVPVISTIPPILNKDDKVAAMNAVVKKIAAEKKIPLVDFHSEILARQPGTAWNGTILGNNDVHPTGDKNFDFSEANLKVCGYALRNFLTCKALNDVVSKVF